ncbi:unnamed protein product [Rotaria socialis]
MTFITVFTMNASYWTTVTIYSPSEKQYEALYQQYPDTIRCPCTSISNPYESFVQVTLRQHQVCESYFIQPWWYESFDSSLNSSIFISSYFRTLSMLCDITKTTLDDAIRQFSSTTFVSSHVRQKQFIVLQTDQLFSVLKSSVITEFNTIIALINEVLHTNQYISGRQTNILLKKLFSNDSNQARIIATTQAGFDDNGQPCYCSQNPLCNIEPYYQDSTIPAMAIHSSIQLDVEIIEEEESSNEIEYEPAAESKNSNSISRLSSNTMEKKTISSKSKRYCKFNKEWIKISKYASFLQERRSDSSLAHCCVCKSNFSIANGGKYLIDRHLEQASHKRLAAIEAENKSRLMFDFIHPPSQLTSMIAAELTLVYHGIRHAHSYNSQSCTVDVSKKLFHDSTIAKNISCGRTKARELAVNVLAPYFSSKIIKAINQNHFYSLSFDASNKGHKKMFPFIINYFTMERGIVRSVIEVIEQPHETANHVVASLREVLEMNNIDIKKMTSIGADNTNVNYGQYHSAFSLLKSDFPNLIKGSSF